MFQDTSLNNILVAHLIKSVRDTIGMLKSKANFLKWGKVAIEPSSTSKTAERTDTGCKPARTTRSTEASV